MSERTRSILRAAVVTLFAALLLPVNACAQTAHTQTEQAIDSPSPHPAAVGFDVVILRPLALAALVVGAVAFVPVALLTAPNGRDSVEAAMEIFVTGPAHDVFRRPLGDL